MTYPVFRLGDSPLTRKLHRMHMYILGFVKVSLVIFPVVLLAYLLLGFYAPSKIVFSTDSQNCAFSPVLLPRLASAVPTEHYKVTTPAKFSINGYPILSTQMCVIPTAIPSASTKTILVRQLKLPLSKKLTIANASSLSASPMIKDDLVSTKSNMIFELSKADRFFGYELLVGGKAVGCVVQDSSVACPTSELGLKQGEPYTFELHQTLGETSQPLYVDSLRTITSVDLVSSSIPPDGTVYDSPLGVDLLFSKTLVRVTSVKIMQEGVEMPGTYTSSGKTVSIKWPTALDRQKSYTISVDSVLADDGGSLESPVIINFKTSGGPKVINTTLPTSKSSTLPDFTLSFDHAVKNEQDFSSIILITASGAPLPATFSVSGNDLRIKAKTSLSACTDFTITIKDTLLSSFGFSGGNAYSMSSRTQCSRPFSIGKSVLGREITAYAIGGGPEKILFIGTIHGNEKSAYYLLSSWIDYLESNPSSIPSDKTIVVIPNANPDGFASGSRFNANNVDLNRNFASINWKKDVKVPGGSTLENGGGGTPLSEPESRAIVDYIQSISPSLVMSYHSQGSIVIGNGSGNSLSLAAMYAGHVGYQNVSPESSAEAFEHDTTGALEDWLHETPDIPVVLLELSSHNTSSIFPYHKTPMLNVLK